jgi:hypothetical protein
MIKDAEFPKECFNAGSGHVGFVVDKVALGRFSQSTLIPFANPHSINCSIAIVMKTT